MDRGIFMAHRLGCWTHSARASGCFRPGLFHGIPWWKYYQGCFHGCSYTMYHIPWFIFRRKRQIWVYHGIPCLTHTHTWFLDGIFTQSCPDGTVFFYHEISIGFTQNHLFGDDYIYIYINIKIMFFSLQRLSFYVFLFYLSYIAQGKWPRAAMNHSPHTGNLCCVHLIYFSTLGKKWILGDFAALKVKKQNKQWDDMEMIWGWYVNTTSLFFKRKNNSPTCRVRPWLWGLTHTHTASSMSWRCRSPHSSARIFWLVVLTILKKY